MHAVSCTDTDVCICGLEELGSIEMCYILYTYISCETTLIQMEQTNTIKQQHQAQEQAGTQLRIVHRLWFAVWAILTLKS